MKLRKYQKEGVEFLSSRHHAILGDDMGLGKTIQAVKAIERISSTMSHGLPIVLVICPAITKRQWESCFLDDGWGSEHIFVFDSAVDADNYQCFIQKHITIISYSLLNNDKVFNEIAKYVFDVLIMDEVHFLKNKDSKRTKKILTGEKAIARSCTYKWGLSGTPMLNRPVELYTILRALAIEKIKPYDTYVKYTDRFCAAYFDGFQRNVRGASNLADLRSRLNGFMIRRLKSDVAKELPKVIENIITVDTAVAVKTSFDNAETLGALATIRRETGMAKLPSIISHIKNVLEQKKKIVVFAYHRNVISALHDVFIEEATVLYGEQSTFFTKKLVVGLFIDNPDNRIIIGQMVAAGTGLDGLQNVCDHIIFAELDWTPGRMLQCIGRLDRLGQRNPVTVDYMVSENEHDQLMWRSVAHKDKNIKEVLGDA